MLWQDEVFEIEVEETDAVGSITGMNNCTLGEILGGAREHAWIYAIRRAVWVKLSPSKKTTRGSYKIRDQKKFVPSDFYDHSENGTVSRRVLHGTEKVVDCVSSWSASAADDFPEPIIRIYFVVECGS